MPNFNNIANNITPNDPVTNIPVGVSFGDPYAKAVKVKPTPEEIAKKAEEKAAAKAAKKDEALKKEAAKKSEAEKKKLEAAKEKAKKEAEKLKKIAKDPSSLITAEKIKDVKKQILALLVPILLQFVRTLNFGDILIKRITIQTKKQLKNKGSLVVSNGSFSFTPSKRGDWNVYKKNFDTKVNNIKQTILSLQKILSLLTNILNVLNLALSAYQMILMLMIAKLKATQAKIIADLSSPSPSKPTAGVELAQLSDKILKMQKLKDDIDIYKLMITAILMFVNIFTMALNKLKVKLDKLKFILNTLDDQSSGAITNATTSTPTTNEYTNSAGKSYILTLVTYPDRSKQYHALDAFSKMKVTQTAPSLIKTPEQLLEEIKQILG